MWRLLTLGAVLALPVTVAAQLDAAPPNAAPTDTRAGADADQVTEVSGLVIEARRATDLSGVDVGGCAMPADSEAYDTRAGRPSANKEFDAPPSPQARTAESSGTREFILRNIAAFREGSADFAHMDDALARITRRNLAAEKFWIVCRGAFRDIRFLHVSEDDYDDFEVDFSGAAIEWEVKPLNSRQVTDHWAARFYYPEPMTRQFDGLLRSMEWGRPDYARVSADFAPVLQARWPSMRRAFRNWRGRRSITFLRRTDKGSYVYKVAYGSRITYWTAPPLDPAGRIDGLSFEERD